MKIIENVKKKIRQTKFSITKTVVVKATDERLLNFAADKGSHIIRMHLSGNPNLTESVIKKLKNDKSDFVRCQMAKHKNSTPDVLEELSFDKNHKVRKFVAGRKDCKKETFEKLSKDPNLEVLSVLISNKNLSVEAANNISKHPSVTLINRLIKNHSLSAEILCELACKHDDYGIKFAIASHPNINSDIVFKLMETYDSRHQQIAYALLKNPGVSTDEKGMITITTGASLEDEDYEDTYVS